jgi:hypothetical protein
MLPEVSTFPIRTQGHQLSYKEGKSLPLPEVLDYFSLPLTVRWLPSLVKIGTKTLASRGQQNLPWEWVASEAVGSPSGSPNKKPLSSTSSLLLLTGSYSASRWKSISESCLLQLSGVSVRFLLVLPTPLFLELRSLFWCWVAWNKKIHDKSFNLFGTPHAK